MRKRFTGLIGMAREPVINNGIGQTVKPNTCATSGIVTLHEIKQNAAQGEYFQVRRVIFDRF